MALPNSVPEDMLVARRGVLDSLRAVVAPVYGLALVNTLLPVIREVNRRPDRGLAQLWEARTSMLYALVLVATIVRFYHGNNMHLIKTYGRPSKIPATFVERATWARLFVDFTVIFSQSILFVLLSFYARPTVEFLALFLVLLFADVFWFLYSGAGSRKTAAESKHMRNWMFNNLGAIAFVGFWWIVYITDVGSTPDWLLHVATGGIALNTLIDFGISWKLYGGRFDDDDEADALLGG